MIKKRKHNFVQVVFAMVIFCFSGNSHASIDSFGSSAESSLVGSSLVAGSYWLAGVDVYQPISRSLGARLFQSNSLQGRGEFDDNDLGLGLSVYRHWGPWFVGMALGGPTSASETAIRAALHGVLRDTTVKLRRRAFGNLLIGYTFMPFQMASLSLDSMSLSMESFSFMRRISFALAGGLMFSRNKLTLKSDETNGSGVLEKFSESETESEWMMKALARVPTRTGEFQFGVAGYRVPGMNLTGASSTFGFPYAVKVDDDWQWDLTLSYLWKF